MDLKFTPESQLIEHLVTPAFVLDASGQIRAWNQALTALTCIDAELMLNTQDHWKAFYTQPQDTLADLIISGSDERYQKFSAQIRTTRGEVKNTLHAESWFHLPSLETPKYLAFDAGPIMDDTGEILGVIQTVRDLTALQRLQESMSALSTCDRLTGLGSRLFFDTQLNNYWYNAQRHRENLALLLIKLDFFKSYHELYGTTPAEQVLSRVATTLTTSVLRGSDQCFRYQDGAFAVLLPATDIDGAVAVAERIRERIYDYNLPHSGSNQHQRISVSIGVAAICPDAQSDTSLLVKHASHALDQAQTTGGNYTQQKGSNSD